MQNYHLVNDGEKWKLERQHAQRASDTYGEQTKAESVKDAAKFVAQHGGGSLKIHNLDGTIQEERTYPRSKDPRRSPG